MGCDVLDGVGGVISRGMHWGGGGELDFYVQYSSSRGEYASVVVCCAIQFHKNDGIVFCFCVTLEELPVLFLRCLQAFWCDAAVLK